MNEVGERTPLHGGAQVGPDDDPTGSSARERTGDHLTSPPADVRRFLFRHLHVVCILTYVGALALSALCFSYWLDDLPVVDSLYFGVVSMTTVGYGDIAPVSPEGRAAAMALTLMGIAMVLGIINKSIEQHFSRRRWWGDLRRVVVALVLATWLMARVEGWDSFTALYFFVVTGTTLGYGDVAPQTPWMKALCVLYIPALVMSFALVVTDRLTRFCTENLNKDAIIKEWIDEKGLTPTSFRQMDVGGGRDDEPNDRVQYTEFLLGMVTYFHEAYGKIPDAPLVGMLKEKFDDLACDTPGYICEEDVATYQRQLREEREREGSVTKTIDLDGFFEVLLLHFDEIPMKDRNARRVHKEISKMFKDKRCSKGTMPYTVGDDELLIQELIRRLK